MSSAKFRVSLTQSAIADFQDILTYTEQTWGSQQVDRYAETLDLALRSLEREPETDDPLPGTGFLFVRAGKHRIFYRIHGQDVKVARILHARMNFESHLD